MYIVCISLCKYSSAVVPHCVIPISAITFQCFSVVLLCLGLVNKHLRTTCDCNCTSLNKIPSLHFSLYGLVCKAEVHA